MSEVMSKGSMPSDKLYDFCHCFVVPVFTGLSRLKCFNKTFGPQGFVILVPFTVPLTTHPVYVILSFMRTLLLEDAFSRCLFKSHPRGD